VDFFFIRIERDVNIYYDYLSISNVYTDARTRHIDNIECFSAACICDENFKENDLTRNNTDYDTKKRSRQRSKRCRQKEIIRNPLTFIVNNIHIQI